MLLIYRSEMNKIHLFFLLLFSISLCIPHLAASAFTDFLSTPIVAPEPKKYKGTLTVSHSNGEITLNLDGEEIELSTSPFIDKNNRTLVPVREFCENGIIDRKVVWHDPPRQVTVSLTSYVPDTSSGGAGAETAFSSS